MNNSIVTDTDNENKANNAQIGPTLAEQEEQLDKEQAKTGEESEVSVSEEHQGMSLFKKAGKKDCSFCLRRDLSLVLVLDNCGHYYCPHCILQQYLITTITLGSGLPQPGKKGSQKLLRCYLCKQYHAINDLQVKQLEHLAESKTIKPPETKPPVRKGLKRCQSCFKITMNVKQIMDAEYECLSCNNLLCQQCVDIHFTNPKNEGHRVLRLQAEANIEHIESDFCITHREHLKHYCFTDRKPLCIVCARYEDHNNHNVRPLKDILREQNKEFEEIRGRVKETIKTIEMSFFKMNVEALQGQKTLYLEKLKQDFVVMYRMIDQKYSEMHNKITEAFDRVQEESEVMKNGFQAYLQRLYFLKTVNPQRDLEILHLNELSEDILSLRVSTDFLHDFDITADSVFINEPTRRLQALLKDYDFRDVSERSVKLLKRCFNGSKILKNSHITPEFFAMFPEPGIQATELLYRMNRDGPSPEMFHKRCDEKGATLIIVSANNGYIFGGYNPTSWVNMYCYSECDDSFLFSLAEPTGKRKPFKCPLKPTKYDFAIKQSEDGFSPGFGEANACDLFLAFKSPERSYSRLGTVYEPPAYLARGLNTDQLHSLLAGRPAEWDIQDIEVYAVNL